MTKLGTIWKNKSISQKTKLKLYRSNVLSVLLYGAECLGLTAGIEKKLASFHQKCLRRILNIRWNSYISNEVVLERADDEDLTKTIRRRRWRYLGHALRMDEKRIPPQAWTWMPTGKRKRGRPRSTLRRAVQRDMQTGSISGIDLHENERDRTGWRALLSALCT